MQKSKVLRAIIRLFMLTMPLCTFVASPALCASSEIAKYALAPGDRPFVIIFGQAELAGEYTVDADGNDQLPLVGPVRVVNKNIGERQSRLKKALASGFLIVPEVCGPSIWSEQSKEVEAILFVFE